MNLVNWIKEWVFFKHGSNNIEFDFDRSDSRLCIIGNIVDKRPHGESGEVRLGTKHFRPNTKVYCFPKYPGIGHDVIEVVGLSRKARKLITISITTNRIKNFRLKPVYKPRIIELIDKNYFYRTWKLNPPTRKEVEAILKQLNEKTLEINN